jgi:uncharacterized membrane protein SpoIIM required for sporulation
MFALRHWLYAKTRLFIGLDDGIVIRIGLVVARKSIYVVFNPDGGIGYGPRMVLHTRTDGGRERERFGLLYTSRKEDAANEENDDFHAERTQFPSFWVCAQRFLFDGKRQRLTFAIELATRSMRETKFIEQNKAKWSEYEQMLQEKDMDADKLNELFVHITDDLAYARTYYPNRSVRSYLNGLANRVFQKIQTRQTFPLQGIKRFWSHELPQITYDSRKALFASFLFFVIAFAIGMLSCTIDPEFPRVILGDGYVDMTLENIKKGDAMAVYKDKEMFGMSGRIAVNNLYVAFITMIYGMLASIGTVFIMLYNGIMVGAFQYLFVQEGVFWESFLTIWIHGTLEISAIIIAGGAGLVAGSGWIFPGTFTRLESFRLSLVRGVKLFLGVVPIIILAAFFEGYLTRATDTPDWVRAAFITMSLAFIVWYFIVLPWQVAHRKHDNSEKEQDLPASYVLDINGREVKSAGRIFNETMGVFIKHFSVLGGYSALLSAVFTALLYFFYIQGQGNSGVFLREFLGAMEGAKRLLYFKSLHPVQWLHILSFPTVCILAYRATRSEMPDQADRPHQRSNQIAGFGLLVAGFWIVCSSMQYENYMVTLFMLTVVTPFICLWGYQLYTKNDESRGLFQLFPFLNLYVSGTYITLFGLLFYLFFETEVYEFLTEIMASNTLQGNTKSGTVLYTVLTTFLCVWIAYMMVALMAISAALTQHSAVEKEYALSLFEGIDEIGTQKKIRGLMKE